MPDDTTDSDGTARDDDDVETNAGTDEYVGAYDKLVRDDIPAVVRADGNRPVTRRVDGGEYERYLARKLREEADEVVDAVATGGGTERSDDEQVLDELADVHAVLDALVDESDHSMASVRERAREKATDRGAFDDGVVLERIDPASERTESGDAPDDPASDE